MPYSIFFTTQWLFSNIGYFHVGMAETVYMGWGSEGTVLGIRDLCANTGSTPPLLCHPGQSSHLSESWLSHILK